MRPMDDDRELLARYARQRDESAFAEIVRRHVDMVYSAALRQMRDPHLAQDVTQAVFILLTQKAGSIGANVILAGWLYHAARMTANNARRAKERRERNERKAGEAMRERMNETIEWGDVEGVLDDAMSRLRPRDREAVVLRFLSRKSLREVGETVGISEDAAKLRVSRAIGRLRQLIGVTAPAAALVAILETNTATAAPPAFAAAVAPAALQAAPASAALVLAKGTAVMMVQAKVKLIVSVAASVLFVAGGTSVLVQHVSGDSAVAAATPTQAIDPIAPATATTAPATQPTVLHQDSPRAVLLSIRDAITNQDPAAIRSLIHANGPLEAAVADAMAEQLAAQGALEAVMKRRFPGEPAIMPPRAQLESSRELVTGDKAVVMFQKLTFSAMKLQGKWYFDAKTVFSPGNRKAQPLARQPALANEAARALRQVAKNLDAGMYANLEEARQAVKSFEQVAATQPSTRGAPAAVKPHPDPAGPPADSSRRN